MPPSRPAGPDLPDASGPGPSVLSPAKAAGWPPSRRLRSPSWRRGAHERPTANTNATGEAEDPATKLPAGAAGPSPDPAFADVQRASPDAGWVFLRMPPFRRHPAHGAATPAPSR